MQFIHPICLFLLERRARSNERITHKKYRYERYKNVIQSFLELNSKHRCHPHKLRSYSIILPSAYLSYQPVPVSGKCCHWAIMSLYTENWILSRLGRISSGILLRWNFYEMKYCYCNTKHRGYMNENYMNCNIDAVTKFVTLNVKQLIHSTN